MMVDIVDKKILNDLILEALENVTIRNDGKYLSTCPNPNHPDYKPSFIYNTDSMIGYCFTKCYSDQYGKDYVTLPILCEWLNIPFDSKRFNIKTEVDRPTILKKILRQQLKTPIKNKTERIYRYDINYYKHTSKSLNYIRSRGFDPKHLIKKYQVGRKIQNGQEYLTFPLFKTDGSCVGLIKRAIPPYLPDVARYDNEPSDFPFNDYLWGINYCDSDRNIIICEGILNAITYHLIGYNAVACLGSNFTEKQRKHIGQMPIFNFDSDKSGKRGYHTFRNKYKLPHYVLDVSTSDGFKDAADYIKHGKLDLLKDKINKSKEHVVF